MSTSEESQQLPITPFCYKFTLYIDRNGNIKDPWTSFHVQPACGSTACFEHPEVLIGRRVGFICEKDRILWYARVRAIDLATQRAYLDVFTPNTLQGRVFSSGNILYPIALVPKHVHPHGIYHRLRSCLHRMLHCLPVQIPITYEFVTSPTSSNELPHDV